MALRALLVLIVVMVGATIITSTLSLLHYPRMRPLMWLTVGLAALAVLFAVACGVLVVSHVQHINSDGRGGWAELGVAFWWMVAAFVLLLASQAMYVWLSRLQLAPASGISEQLLANEQASTTEGGGAMENRYFVEVCDSEQILPVGT